MTVVDHADADLLPGELVDRLTFTEGDLSFVDFDSFSSDDFTPGQVECRPQAVDRDLAHSPRPF